MVVLKYIKLDSKAYQPIQTSNKAAGFDLKSLRECIILKRGKFLVDTGIKIELPEGCYGRIAPRSGLALHHGLDVGVDVIDEDYRSEIKVLLFNNSDFDYTVKSGERITQLICIQIYHPDIQQVIELSKSERKEGFGSSGKTKKKNVLHTCFVYSV